MVLAEGLPAETFLDTGNRSNFANGGGAVALHPDFSTIPDYLALHWETFGCAPLVLAGEKLAQARALLAAQPRHAA